MSHPIVAYRIKGTKDGLEISTMTASPRGTKVLLDTLKITNAQMERGVRASNLKSAFEALNPKLVREV